MDEKETVLTLRPRGHTRYFLVVQAITHWIVTHDSMGSMTYVGLRGESHRLEIPGDWSAEIVAAVQSLRMEADGGTAAGKDAGA